MNKLVAALAAAVLVLGLAACQHAKPAAAQASNMQLKLYHVPENQSDQVVKALHSALAGNTLDGWLKKQDNGMRVTEPFPGTVMVLAPPEIQASVGTVIHALSDDASKAPPAKARQARNLQFRVHFWVVDMLPGRGADAPALQPLAPTLDALRKRLGTAHFELADTASATVLEGHTSNFMNTANRHRFEFWVPSASAGHVQLALKYVDRSPDGFHGLKTSASMTLGDYVVLAQAAAPKHLPLGHGKPPPTGAMRLLVVRVDKLAAHAD